MKVLLFAPPFEVASKDGPVSYPLALGYLGAVLEKKGIEVKAFDFLFEKWNDIKSRVSEIIRFEKPDFVGISSMTTNRVAAFEIVKISKKINPSIKVILGGVHPTIMYKQILENFPVDFIVMGEGEETIVELIEKTKRKIPLDKLLKIKGIAFKHNNQIIKTEQRRFVKHLDKIPFPKHEYFEDKIKEFKIAYLTTSRGCPIGCTFCSTSLHWGRMRRQRSVKNVIEELKMLKKKYPDLKRVYFNDDEFLISPVWISEFCDSLIKEKLNLKFECVGRVTSISEEIVMKLKKAGCIKISLGVESGSPKIIKFIKKSISIEQIVRAFNICKKQNMPAGIYLMVGLPGENRKTVKETINLLKKIRNAQFGNPSLFQIYPGTEVYELAKKQGFIDDSYWLTKKIAPFYTYEHPKIKLLFWSMKISLYHKFYQGKFFEFIFSNLKSQLTVDRLRKIIRKYIV